MIGFTLAERFLTKKDEVEEEMEAAAFIGVLTCDSALKANLQTSRKYRIGCLNFDLVESSIRSFSKPTSYAQLAESCQHENLRKLSQCLVDE
ncbi:hypothetical protein OIU74_024055 [Salix koriyanagi]|uniref:Uncharacterized protein n=1 Tax=Salix koriyanagi TaxID=2511006 RepID=A0A9Q1ABR6_9ROSI|nr:hypothetical protein OIU74_024055 [Salix koriyanagi]